MYIYSHPTRSGLLWFVSGLRLFTRSPVSQMLWVLNIIFVSVFIPTLLIPTGLGILLLFAFIILYPSINLMTLAGYHLVDTGRPFSMFRLHQAFKNKGVFSQQLTLGGVHLLGIFLALILASFVLAFFMDQTLIQKIGDTNTLQALTEDEQVKFIKMGIMAMSLMGVFYAPMYLIIWLAPILIGRHQYSAFKAIALALRAMGLNWKPMMIYLLICLLTVLIPQLLMMTTIQWLKLAPDVANILYIPILVALTSIRNASHYSMYQTVFISESNTYASPIEDQAST